MSKEELTEAIRNLKDAMKLFADFEPFRKDIKILIDFAETDIDEIRRLRS